MLNSAPRTSTARVIVRVTASQNTKAGGTSVGLRSLGDVTLVFIRFIYVKFPGGHMAPRKGLASFNKRYSLFSCILHNHSFGFRHMALRNLIWPQEKPTFRTTEMTIGLQSPVTIKITLSRLRKIPQHPVLCIDSRHTINVSINNTCSASSNGGIDNSFFLFFGLHNLY